MPIHAKDMAPTAKDARREADMLDDIAAGYAIGSAVDKARLLAKAWRWYADQHDAGDRVRISYDPPPIPVRDFDYYATLDGYDGGDPIGHGKSRDEALTELMIAVEEAR